MHRQSLAGTRNCRLTSPCCPQMLPKMMLILNVEVSPGLPPDCSLQTWPVRAGHAWPEYSSSMNLFSSLQARFSNAETAVLQSRAICVEKMLDEEGNIESIKLDCSNTIPHTY